MYKKRIKYTDFNDAVREEDFYFNISKSEIVKMEISEDGGLQERLERVIQAKKGREIMEVFENLILSSYGVRSLDGKSFSKSPEVIQAFKDTAAYDVFFMELVTDAEAAAIFVNAVFPADLVAEADKTRAASTARDGFRPGHEPATDARPGSITDAALDVGLIDESHSRVANVEAEREALKRAIRKELQDEMMETQRKDNAATNVPKVLGDNPQSWGQQGENPMPQG